MKAVFLGILAWILYKFFEIRYYINLENDDEQEREDKKHDDYYDKKYRTAEGVKHTQQRILKETEDGFTWEIKNKSSNEPYNGNLIAVNERRKAETKQQQNNNDSTTIQ